MQGAAYARTSKDTDDAFSVSSQLDAILAYAKANNITISEDRIFKEDYTGKSFDRPEYSKIRELIKSRSIDAVIVYATDRLARRVSVGEIFLDEMTDNGVELHNVSWGTKVGERPEDKLRFNFETTFSSFERDKIIERVMRGKTKIAESGKLIGHSRPVYGYSYNELKNGVVPNEYASIVKEIFEQYGLHQVNPAKIADSLNSRGIPTPGILKANEYLSIAELKYKAGRISQVDYERLLEYVAFIRGNEKWSNSIIHTLINSVRKYTGDYTTTLKGIVYHSDAPPIISLETAEAVERMLAVGRQRFARREGQTPFLMARRLKCAICGYAYSVRPKGSKYFTGYYACMRRPNKPICTNKPVRNDVIDPLTRQFIRELFTEPDRLFSWWQQQHTHDEQANQKAQEQIKQIDERLVDLQSKLFRTLDRLTDKLDENEQAFYTSQREDLKRRIAEYKEDKEELKRSLVVTTVDQETILEFSQIGEEYKEVLETSFDFSFWRGLVEDIDLSGEVGIDEQGQYIDFIVFGGRRKREYIEPQSGWGHGIEGRNKGEVGGKDKDQS